METERLVGKKIFIIAPVYLGLYQDVVKALNNMGSIVQCLPYTTFPEDPFLLSYNKKLKISKELFLSKLKDYWQKIYDSGKYSFEYDYLLVIDGTIVHPYLFNLLKEKNQNIKSVNYLFDGIDNVYRFDRNFQYYDKIYTYDLHDSKKYNIPNLPIFWVEEKTMLPIEREVFGLGTYNKTRYSIFSRISKILTVNNIGYFIKLYCPKPQGFIHKAYYSFKKLKFARERSLFTSVSMDTPEFRRMIMTSNTILDTSNGYQDGLTTRFMWSIGLNKKIITNNKSIISYPFYDKNQILILDDNYDEVIPFINKDFSPNEENVKFITRYRIDNWLTELLDFD